jgi:hypothetical protein
LDARTTESGRTAHDHPDLRGIESESAERDGAREEDWSERDVRDVENRDQAVVADRECDTGRAQKL